jgi:glycosyltransferase involved in cell wall biosynthesis
VHGCPLGKATAHQHVVFIGQVAEHKGVDVLVDAFTRLALDYPSAHLHIIGNVADSGFRDHLVSRAYLEMKCRVTFWGYREDARNFLENAYLLVQPTRPSLAQESAGLAVLEAMAVGVPSIAFRSGALPEIVVHGKTGLVCTDDSVECLESALRTVLSDRGLRDRLGAGARDRFEAHYAPERARASWLRLLGVANLA